MGAMWDSVFLEWERRNQDLHGHDFATRRTAQHKMLQREIQLIYANRDKTPPGLQHVYSTPLEELLKKKNYHQHSWLETLLPVLQPQPDPSSEGSLE